MDNSSNAGLDRLTVAAHFLDAVRQANFERAQILWVDMPAAPGDDVYAAAIDWFVEAQRWDEAAATLELLRCRPDDFDFRRRLFRNLSALREHRPTVYRVVFNVDIGSAYQLVQTPSGLMSIAIERDGRPLHLCPGIDPSAALRQVTGQSADALRAGAAMALAGIGDGYVLGGLAALPQTYALGREQAIFLFEPDPRLLFACLLLHDFTGPGGPIEQQRVRWYVGHGWASAFRVDALTDRFLPFPTRLIKLNPDTAEIDTALRDVLGKLQALDQQAADTPTAHYASTGPTDFTDALARNLGRPPRAALLTTRFSSVLHHSTADTAAALRQHGFETLTLIEPTPWHALHKVGMRRALADFKPDVVFQIDHHRFEHGDLIPPQVPFVNWVQDMLPHLMTSAAGKKLGTRDFVLVPSLPRWVKHYAYPERQCLEFRKLARVPARPAGWTSESGLIVYVSNWSRPPKGVAEEMIANASESMRAALRHASNALIDAYARGESFPTHGSIRQLLDCVLAAQEIRLSDDVRHDAVIRLYERVNNALYRQQGLRWAVAAAGQLDLRLEIYGSGWDENPEFADYACGTIAYGEPLEELTRRAAVNLVLEPYVCVAHQRLPDALVAGGFCLVRDHPNNTTLQTVTHMLPALRGYAGEVTTTTLRQRLNDHGRTALDEALRVVAETDATPGLHDYVALVDAVEAAGIVRSGEELLPRWRETTFNDAAALTRMLARFAVPSETSRAIAAAQRTETERRFGYPQGIGRAIKFVTQRLHDEARQSRRAA